MQKDYPRLFNQNDYGSVDLGTSTVDTIKSGGCFDCCCAMKACFYGHDTDPIQMNKLLVDDKVYIDLDLLPDNAASRVFPDIRYIKTIDYEPIPTDLNTISTLLADPGTTLTIRINFGHGNFHFVEAVSCDGSTLHIANPISGNIEDFNQRYGNPVTANLHVLVFSGPVVQAQTADTTTSTPLAVRFTQAITKSANFDAVADYLKMTADDRVRTTAGQVAVDRYKQLEQDAASLSDKLSKLTALPAQTAPVDAPGSPVGSVSVQTTTVAFKDGTAPVSSTQASVSSNSVKKPFSPLPQSGQVSIAEFLKAAWRVLFL